MPDFVTTQRGSDPTRGDDGMNESFNHRDGRSLEGDRQTTSAATVSDRTCGRCGHPKSCHGEHGCEVEVRDYGDLDCFCHGFAPAARTKNGNIVIACYCGGGDVHLYQPNGGGARILACPPEPLDKPETAS